MWQSLKYFLLFLVLCFISTVVLEETCDDACKFTDSYITPETIEKWPTNCNKVCGRIFIKNVSLPEKQLKEKFSKLKTLVGDLDIIYTNFTSLNFLNQKISFYSGTNGVAIRLNPLLTNVTALSLWTAKSGTHWYVYNNPKLNFEPFCDKALYDSNIDINVYGNLKNCGCKNVRIGPSSLLSYTNCTSIDGGMINGLKLSQLNDSFDLSGLLKLQTITGRLEVYGTNFTSLSFLENLALINMSLSEELNIIDIWSNSKLTKLGFGSLKKLVPNKYGLLRISFAFNHPDLCLTTNELQLLAEHKVVLYTDPELKLCQETARKDGEKACSFQDLSKMDQDCQHVIGDVLVDSNNEKFTGNLGNVTNIYGSLTVTGTNELTSLGFLSGLRQVANVKYERKYPLVRITSNKKLQRVAFQNMKTKLYPDLDTQVILIKDNDLAIFKTKDECLALQNSTKTEIEYNGQGCYEFAGADEEQEEEEEGSSISNGGNTTDSGVKKSNNRIYFSLALIVFLLIFFI